MAQPSPQIEFHFVNSSITSPIVPKDHAVRTLIRKQAMKKASAARRRDGSYGKHNLRQYPVFIVDKDTNGTQDGWVPAKQEAHAHDDNYFVHVDEIVRQEAQSTTPESSNSDDSPTYGGRFDNRIAERQRFMRRLALNDRVPANLSAKGYELTSIKSHFDILNLSTLATLHVGRAVRSALSRDPYNLVQQLRAHQRWSYLAFLPSRYENVPCLRDATNCVTARARYIIHPKENWEAAVISFYVKALDSLQKALDCPKTRFQPEVLCATEILALYELLDPSGEKAWIRHAAGAAKLIQLRGPKNYNTEFEKALFINQTFAITTECLLKGERCFIEQKPWQHVMQTVIKEDCGISDRSEIVVKLLMLKSFVPGLNVDVCNIIFGDMTPEPEFIESIASRLRLLGIKFKNWNEQYQLILSDLPDMYLGSANHDSHCKIYANYLSTSIIVNRLLAAISSIDREEAEGTAQELANEMLDIENEVRASPTCLFMAHGMIIAQATRETADEWVINNETEDENYINSNGLIERWKLAHWAEIFGRKMAE